MLHQLRTLFLAIILVIPCALRSQDKPSLYAPPDGIITGEKQITLRWNALPGAISYTLQIDDDRNFISPLLNLTGLTTNAYTVSNPASGKTYYWRVQAQLPSGFSPWSNKRKYTIFRPVDIPGLRLWLRADTGVIMDAQQRVSQWEDLSGNSFDAFQNITTRKPVWQDSVVEINQQPALIFDGVDDGMVSSIPASWKCMHDGTPNATFMVLKVSPSNPENIYALLTTSQGTTLENGFILAYDDRSQYNRLDNIVYEVYRSIPLSPYVSNINNNFIFPPARFNILSNILIPNSPGDDHRLHVNTVAGNGKETSGTPASSNPASELNIGKTYLDNLYLNGAIAEIIIYCSAIDDSLRQLLQGYLRSRYALYANLGPDIRFSYGFCDTIVLNPGDGFTAYQWSTGDTTPLLTVTSPGTYSVTVTDYFGFTSVDSIIISGPQIPLPQSNFICHGNTLVWNASPGGPYAYLWDDNSTDSIRIITSGGTYSVTVTDTNGCVSTRGPINITIDSFSIIATLGPDITLCTGQSIKLVSGQQQAVSYLWSDGTTLPALPVFTTGDYSLTVTSINGCVATDTIHVTVVGASLNPDFQASQGCLGDTTFFTDLTTTGGSTVVSWLWKFGDGASDSIQNPIHRYSNSGTFPVTLIVTTSAGCKDSLVKNVTVYGLPQAFFADSLGCVNSPFKFKDLSTAPAGQVINRWFWDFGNGDTSNLKNPYTSYNSTGIFTVVHTVTTDKGCTDTFSKAVNIMLPQPSPGMATLIYPPDNYTLYADTNTFQWLAANHANRYRFQIATDASFNNLIVNQADITTTNATLWNLPMGDDFYWRVISFNLCGDSTISTAYHFTTFLPNLYPGLQLWLRADENVIRNGQGFVTQWRDNSGNNRHANQSGQNVQPVWVSSVPQINDMPAVQFDGTDDYLEAGTAGDWRFMHDGTDYTVFIVGKIKGSTSTNLQTWMATNSGTTTKEGFIFTYDNRQGNFGYENLLFYIFNGNAGTYTLQNNGLPGDFPALRYGVITNLMDFGSPGIDNQIYVTGRLKSSAETLSAPAINNPESPLRIGVMAGGWNPLNGEIAEVIIYGSALNDSSRQLVERYLIHKYSPPPVDLGPDIHVPYGFCSSFTLDASNRYYSYNWSTGDTTQSINITTPGVYSVTVTDVFGAASTDAVIVDIPAVNQLNDVTLCLGDTLTWDLMLSGGYSYLWSTGDTTRAIHITRPGTYWATIIDTNTPPCSLTTQPVTVTVDSFAMNASLGGDDTLCRGETLTLNASDANIVSYLWSDFSTDSFLVIQSAGIYSVTAVNDRGCMAVDSVNISVQGRIANIQFDASDGCIGDTVEFENDSEIDTPYQIIAVLWDFGDGNTSTTFEPVHLYSDTGRYTVTLTIESDSGCIVSASRPVKIHAPPAVKFTYDDATCARFDIQFNDGTLPPPGDFLQYWMWDFGDSSVAASADPQHDYDSAGVYTVTLTVTTDKGCSATARDTIEIFPPVLPAFEVDKVCAGQTTQFFDETTSFSIIQWQWDFGDGTISTTQNPQHTYNNAGDYAVSLSVTNAIGCMATTSRVVTIFELPEARFIADSTCPGVPLLFIDDSDSKGDTIRQWHWNFGDGKSATGVNPVHIYDTTGTYMVTLQVITEGGCQDVVTQAVSVVAPPKAGFTFTPGFGAAPLEVDFINQSENATEYLWLINDTLWTNSPNPAYTFLKNGGYTITLIAIGSNGCADTIVKSISIAVTILDIATTQIYIDQQIQPDGDYRVSVAGGFLNAGTRTVYSFDVKATLENFGSIIEQWEGSLAPGAQTIHPLKSEFIRSATGENTYVCVEALHPEGEMADDNPANDKLCVSLEDDIEIVMPFPNPVNDVLNFGIILPIADNLKISVYNATGQLMDDLYDGPGKKGYSAYRYPVNKLSGGLYFLRVSYRGKSYQQKFEVAY